MQDFDSFSIVVLQSNGLLAREIPVVGYAGSASISEDGRSVAYVRDRNNPEVVVVNLNNNVISRFKVQGIKIDKFIPLEADHVSVR